jgi:hypothetical protein
MRLDRRNRVLWAVLGLALLAAGLAGLLAAGGVLGERVTVTPLVPDGLARPVTRASRTLTLGATLALALLAVGVGWRLVRAQLRREPRHGRLADLELLPTATEPAGPAGRTLIRGQAVLRTLEEDLEHVRGVRLARVGLLGTGDRPDLRLWLDVDDGADVTAVRAGADAAFERLGVSTGWRPRDVDITVRILVPARLPRS